MIKNIHSYITLAISLPIGLPISAAGQQQELQLLALSQQLTTLAKTTAQPLTPSAPSTPPSLPARPPLFLQPSHLPSNVTIIDSSLNRLAPSPQNLAKIAAAGVSIIQPTVVWQNLSVGAFLGRQELVAQMMAEGCGYDAAQFKKLVALSRINNTAWDDRLQKIVALPDADRASFGGGAESCGYHSIAHLQTILEALPLSSAQRSKKLTLLMDLERVNTLFASPQISLLLAIKPLWRDWIKEHNTFTKWSKMSQSLLGRPSGFLFENPDGTYLSDKDGEWLQADGVAFLARHFMQHSFNAELSWEIIACTRDQQLIQTKETKASIQAKKIATFTLFEAQSRHWFDIIVLTEKDAAQVIILDSKNKPRYDHLTLNAIIRMVFEKIKKPIPATLNALVAPVVGMSEQEQARTARENILMEMAATGDLAAIKELFPDITPYEKKLVEAISGKSFSTPIERRAELLADAIQAGNIENIKKLFAPLTPEEDALVFGRFGVHIQ